MFKGLSNLVLFACNVASLAVNNTDKKKVEAITGKKQWEINKTISNIRNSIYIGKRI